MFTNDDNHNEILTGEGRDRSLVGRRGRPSEGLTDRLSNTKGQQTNQRAISFGGGNLDLHCNAAGCLPAGAAV